MYDAKLQNEHRRFVIKREALKDAKTHRPVTRSMKCAKTTTVKFNETVLINVVDRYTISPLIYVSTDEDTDTDDDLS